MYYNNLIKNKYNTLSINFCKDFKRTGDIQNNIKQYSEDIVKITI